ncbi:hypothetical protein [Nocardioides albus]|uniref:Uncharacterized protein n=1 Tax=Nocardioides albus TaxID=1841 RepID=A0A7W5F8H5_9ACTN|nr:hypothetical protein [Nocardioides albus]MBB3089138.1 hypothetical protein [Nocardioides albus]GGU13997.1 hypothetical protein GCM10007979_10480 [Nocardioides albus]
MTHDLERLLRWEHAGATWEAIWPRADEVTIVLCTCDSGEEVDRYTSAAADLLEHVRGQSGAEPR